MAKMFYTLDEAAAKLGKSPDEVKQMVSKGQLQEFRDRDRLMFKVDQVDLLAGGGEDELIPLADSGELEPITLSSSGSGSSISLAENPKEQTGVSIFDTEETEDTDSGAMTQVTQPALADFSADAASSGSGLLDLTQEADDTSLGADLLGGLGEKQEDTAAETTSEGALFEESPGVVAEPAGVSPAMAAFAPEVYDGPGSGLVGGLALGGVLTTAFALAVLILGMTGASSGLMDGLAGNMMMIVGGLGALTLLLGGIAWFVGRRG